VSRKGTEKEEEAGSVEAGSNERRAFTEDYLLGAVSGAVRGYGRCP